MDLHTLVIVMPIYIEFPFDITIKFFRLPNAMAIGNSDVSTDPKNVLETRYKLAL